MTNSLDLFLFFGVLLVVHFIVLDFSNVFKTIRLISTDNPSADFRINSLILPREREG